MRMRKIFILILAAALMTACGRDEEISGSSESIPAQDTSVTTNTSAETTTAAETSRPEDSSEAVETSSEESNSAESVDAETSNKQEASKNTDTYGSYEDAIKAYIEAMNKGDYESFLHLMYPEKAVRAMLSISELTDAAKEIKSDDKKYELTDIVEEAVLTDNELDGNALLYDQVAALSDILEEHDGNIKELTDEERNELTNKIMDITGNDPDSVVRTYKALKGYDVTVHYTVNGEPEEDYFYVCLIDGEGWKINNTMRKYIKKSRIAAANAIAKTVFIAYTSALCDYEPTRDGSLFNAFLIGSDDSMTYNVPENVDVNELKKIVEESTPEAKNYDYFVVLQDGACAYAAVKKKDSGGELGVYPAMNIPVSSNGKTIETESMDRTKEYTLEDLYEMTKGLIKK